MPQAQPVRPASSPCCGGRAAVAPRELDFPYYNLRDGFQSTLLLVSDSPKPMDFTLGIRSSVGEMLTTSEIVHPGEKLSIDLASSITKLGGDPAGTFAEGSVAVYYVGTIMPIVGQISIRNPLLGMEHESEMVENDPGRSDVPPVLNGVWWGLGSGRQAQVMVTNVGGDPAVADVHLDFHGKQHALPVPLTLAPGQTQVLDITQLLGELGIDPSSAPEGGITIAEAGPHPSLIANGKITDIATGYSSTIYFPSPELERASAVEATGLPVGTPSKDSPFAETGTFTPHVVLRNLLDKPQEVTVTVEYPRASASALTASVLPGFTGGRFIRVERLPGDVGNHAEWGAGDGTTTVGSMAAATLTLAAYSTLDYSLTAAISQLPQPLPFCSIRVQYSGGAGSIEAQVSSVETSTGMVVDARVENEADSWAGSGANPWHLDKDTESILFLTNESDKPARIGFSITANAARYNLTKLLLQPHETRSIDIRQLRDAQLADYKGSVIPAAAADGSVTWVRLDNVPIMGRLMVIARHKGTSASYDCCICPCPSSMQYCYILPTPPSAMGPHGQMALDNYESAQDCNMNWYGYNVTEYSSWASSNTGVATMSASTVVGVAAGSTNISATYTGYAYDYNGSSCDASPVTSSGGATVNISDSGVPDHLQVQNDTYNYDQCPNGLTLVRYITYEVDDANGIPVSSFSVDEAFSGVSSNSCGNGAPSPAPCGSHSYQFTDTVSVGCNSVGDSCGLNINIQQWHWCQTSYAEVALGTLYNWQQRNDSTSVTVNGKAYAMPPPSGQIPDDTDIYP